MWWVCGRQFGDCYLLSTPSCPLWWVEAPSSVSFPSLFAFVALKEAWVNDCWSGLEEREGWCPQFSRLFND